MNKYAIVLRHPRIRYRVFFALKPLISYYKELIKRNIRPEIYGFKEPNTWVRIDLDKAA